MALSNMLFSPPSGPAPPGPAGSSSNDFIFPAGSHPDLGFGHMSSSRRSSVYSANDLTASTVTDRSAATAATSSTAAPTETGASHQDLARRPPPSGLAIALARQKSSAEASPAGSVSDPTTPTAGLPALSENAESRNRAAVYDGLLAAPSPAPSGAGDERSPLLVKMAQGAAPTYGATHQALPLPIGHQPASKQKQKQKRPFDAVALRVKKVATLGTLTYVAKTSVASVPAVILGTLLNILDGVSCASRLIFSHCRR